MDSTPVDSFVHLTWETEGCRTPLSADRDEIIHRTIHRVARDLDLEPVAVGCAWDHVHTLIGWEPRVPYRYAVDAFKRHTRRRWRRTRRDPTSTAPLVWADGYASCSVLREEIPAVERYLDLQKSLHGAGLVWPRFERPYLETDADRPSHRRTRRRSA